MPVTARLRLSGSTDGKPIKIAATTSAGDLVHTAHATALDEIYLWLYNAHTAAVPVTIEDGSTSAPIMLTLPPGQGYMFIGAPILLTNSATVKIFAGTTNVIYARGHAMRFS